MGKMKEVFVETCELIKMRQEYQAIEALVELGWDPRAAKEAVYEIRKNTREEKRKSAQLAKHLQRLRNDVESQLFS